MLRIHHRWNRKQGSGWGWRNAHPNRRYRRARSPWRSMRHKNFESLRKNFWYRPLARNFLSIKKFHQKFCVANFCPEILRSKNFPGGGIVRRTISTIEFLRSKKFAGGFLVPKNPTRKIRIFGDQKFEFFVLTCNIQRCNRECKS